MSERPALKYFTGQEADMLTFYRVPKILIKDPYFKELSSHAKLLYGLALDKMSLSLKNGWIDGENRAYIYYSRENIMEDLGISKGTAKAAVDQLIECGLLEIKKQGLGKSDILYLKNFVIENEEYKAKKCASRGPKIDPLCDVQGQFLTSNKNKLNNNNLYNISTSNLISSNLDTMGLDKNKQAEYTRIVRKNIELESLLTAHPYEKDEIWGIFDLIIETLMITDSKLLIASAWYPIEVVQQKFLKLDYGHIDYVLETMRKNDTKVRNIKKYLLAALFNAPSTIGSYYRAEVNHDTKSRAVKVMGEFQ